MPSTIVPLPDPTHEQADATAFESDPDYWDFLDQLEADAGGCREWDNAE